MSEASVTTCYYPRSRALIALWPLLIGIACACGAIQGILQGGGFGLTFFILTSGAFFGFAVAGLGLFQTMTVKAAKDGLEATSLFGRIKGRLSWDEIESADYYEWPGKRGSNKPSNGYAFNRHGDRAGFSFRKHRIQFGEDMTGYDEMEDLVRKKSTEHAFPIKSSKNAGLRQA